MKCLGKMVLSLITSIMVGLPLQGCCSHTSVGTSPLLVVEEQHAEITPENDRAGVCKAQFTIDVPVNGPQVLVDSVMALLNRELSYAFEIGLNSDDNKLKSDPMNMNRDDAKHLLSHYMDIYEPLLKDELDYTFSFILKMESQTESFVTYGLEYIHCGASCGSEKYYYTFDCHDGHQVQDILSHDNLVRFFEDYPEYSTMEEYDWQFYVKSVFYSLCNGLLDDHFSLVVMGCGNNYIYTEFPYSQIYSYLSPEAQELVKHKGEEETMLPAYLPKCSEDGQAWMEVDTVHHALLGCLSATDGPLVDTLTHYEPELEIYPKLVHSIDASDGSTVYLFIYSRGHLQYYDEAQTYMVDEYGFRPLTLFQYDGQWDCRVSCMWYDQLVAASNGFPYDELDENRFGIHYDRPSKSLYVPIMEHHEEGSGYENCLRYTGLYEVFHFNGEEFVPADNNGAWWLYPDLRNYKRTVSNKKTAEGYEQIDLMPDGTYRRAFWKGAKTLDDLRKKPSELKDTLSFCFN